MKSLIALCITLGVGLVVSTSTAASDPPLPKSRAENVVLVVWGGLGIDFITPQHHPTLYGLAQKGVFSKRHHPVYISSTEVNGTALATGCYPIRSGIMANSDYRPLLGWLGPNATEGVESIRRGDLMSD